LLTAACSSHLGHRSSVRQGGLEIPEAQRTAAVVPVVEETPADPAAAAPPDLEAGTPDRGAAVDLPAPAVLEEEPTAPPESVADERPPSPLSREPAVLPAAETAAVIPEETEPSPDLVSPEDDRLIEEIESTREAGDAGAPPDAPQVRYDIPLVEHSRIPDYIELFQTTRRESFTRGLSRSRKYEKIIVPILREEGVPTDLYYLALIESAFNPKAYSRSKAMGIWQFIYTTGRAYGLRRTHWIDERRDPVKATHAAARHLKDLYEELGSWPLALAGYNAGVNRVKRAIKKGGTRDFWKLRLPAQTRNYVPAFYAALIIGKDPGEYGFDIDYDAPVEYETVEVDGGTRLSLVATFCHTSLQGIRDINPEIRQGCAPPGGAYSLRIPPGKSEEVVAGLARTPRSKITGWGSYHIRSGDTLSTIARDFGTTVEAIQEVNNLSGHFIKAGGRIMIPGGGIADGSIPRAPRVETSLPASGKYRVRRGDSLWSISRRFGLSLEGLTALNGISTGSVLGIGQVLLLRPPPGTAAVAAARPSGRGGATLYRVRKGDNLWGIARKFDTDLRALLRANRITRGQTIYPGEQIIIPGGSL